MLHVDPDLAEAGAEDVPPARRAWTTTARVVGFRDSYGDLVDSAHAALCDAKRCGSLAWERAVSHDAMAACVASLAAGLGIDVGLADEACEALPDACGAFVASVRDGEEWGRPSRTVTLVGAANVYDLVDVTLSFPGGAVRLHGEPVGLSWTGHAVQRFYERTGGRTVASEAFAAALSADRALVGLACEVALARGFADRVLVPCSEGLLVGRVGRVYVGGGWSRDVHARDGFVEVSPVEPLPAAAEWTGMTYIAPPCVRQRQEAYATEWARLSRLPEVMALEALAGRPGADARDVAAARYDALDVADHSLRAMLSAIAAPEFPADE